MSDIAIRCNNLGKQYRIGQQESYRALRDTITDTLTYPARRLRSLFQPQSEIAPESSDFWALKDVNFEVKHGEVVGIIGRNGAGKSTLLKILSRITKPTTGEVFINGRVGSLLEVGTGFHPELTGRENIYLNGAILGMKRAEIKRKFDEIVAFAEIERFLDTPVKRYSSGMYTRLAFSVAAHLEPELLVVDEVLAVGDASFQRKCLNKMQDVGAQGRTVIFVSHNMPSITRLCQRAILLDEGGVVADGPAAKVVGTYLHSGLGTTAARAWTKERAPGNGIARLISVRAYSDKQESAEAFDIRHPVAVEMEFEVLQPGHVLVPNYHFISQDGVHIFAASDLDPQWRRRPRSVGRYVSTAWIPGNFLAEGTVLAGAAVSTMDPVIVHFYEPDAIAFQIVDSLEGDSARGDYAGPMPGVVRPILHWTMTQRQEHEATWQMEVAS